MPEDRSIHQDLPRRGRLGLWSVAVVAALLLAAAVFGRQELERRLSPVDPQNRSLVAVHIAPGANTWQIAQTLQAQGLIRDAWAFHLYTRWRKLDGRLQAGDYQLGRHMSVDEILQALGHGREAALRFTIPEGYTVREVADALAKQGLVRRERFLQVVRDPRFLPPYLPPGAPLREPLEGYLFPDTYLVEKGTSEEDIVRMMRNRFEQVMKPEYRQRAEQLGLSVHQVVTLAALIEKEATAQDRERVSAVFHNRLKQKMNLAACASVNYLLEKPKHTLSLTDVEIDSPYNTYKNAGLPPGPIANPGEAAIRAALYPAQTEDLFFVVKGDGQHVFARSYEEHLANIKRYEESLAPGVQQ